MTSRRVIRFLVLGVVLVPPACSEPAEAVEEPTLLTTDLPFQYPVDLFSARVEGEVGLHLFVDSLGLVVPESTAVAEPSGHAAFDAAALAGAPYLEFRPAHAGGSRVGRTVVLPVKFRLPPADSLAADTLRGKR
jgi:TonB family protein